MAEVSSPVKPTDWTFNDRQTFTARWNDANCLNLMRGAAGAAEYTAIAQRAAFYHWMDQIREVQGHDTLWPAAAWVVASQMGNVDKPLQSMFLSDKMQEFAREGNKLIFDDVFPKLGELYKLGLAGKPLTGKDADDWDRKTLHNEQFVVIQPVYERYCTDADLKAEVAKLAAGDGLFAFGGVAIGFKLDFKGTNVLDPQQRFDHGMNVVVPFFKAFQAAVKGSRQRRQVSKPDPTAHGMVKFVPATAPPPPAKK